MAKTITSRGEGGPDFKIMGKYPSRNVTSESSTQFTDELAKNESEQENLNGLTSNKIIIHNVAINSHQNLHFRLEFYSKDTFANSDLNIDTFLGAVELDLTKYRDYKKLSYGLDERGMITEVLTGYTAVDPGLDFTITPSRVTFDTVRRDMGCYVSKDFGVDYFSGDFTQYLTLFISAHGGLTGEIAFPWAMANSLGGYVPVRNAGLGMLMLYLTKNGTATYKLTASEVVGILAGQGSIVTLNVGTIYYLTIVRDETWGAFGILYCYVYSDPARTVPVGTSGRGLTGAKQSFRYQYALQGVQSGATGNTISGYTEKLVLEETHNYWYHHNVGGIYLPYEDLDGTKELHMVLKNLSPITKGQGDSGRVKIGVDYELAA